MDKTLKLLAACAVLATASVGEAAQIGIGDFTSPTIVSFGRPGPSDFATEPLTVGPATFTDASASINVIWWGPDNPYNDCIGGCVTTDSAGITTLNVDIAPGYNMVGFYVGQATLYALEVSFYDSASNLLGTVVAGGPDDGVTFAGWRNEAGTIGSISIFNPLNNGYRVAAQSGYFENEEAVPEPATWAMLLVGFGFAGAAIRRGRISVARARAA